MQWVGVLSSCSVLDELKYPTRFPEGTNFSVNQPEMQSKVTGRVCGAGAESPVPWARTQDLIRELIISEAVGFESVCGKVVVVV